MNVRSVSKPRNTGFTPGKRSAFTLIELLVVIAIIAILAAILFPVFAQAREKARQTSCLSNEKQLALAVLMYNQDYDQTYPQGGRGNYGGFWIDYDISWPKLLLPYIKTLGVYRCPSDTLDDPTGNMAFIGAGNAISYNLNAFQRDYSAFGQGSNRSAGPIGTPNNSGLAEAAVKNPTSTILLTEVHNADAYAATNNGGTGANGTWFNAFPMEYRAGIGWSKLYNGNIPDGRDGKPLTNPTNPKYDPNSINGSVSAHHSGMANFAFCDGHVKAMKPATTNPNYVTNPELNMWDGLRP